MQEYMPTQPQRLCWQFRWDVTRRCIRRHTYLCEHIRALAHSADHSDFGERPSQNIHLVCTTKCKELYCGLHSGTWAKSRENGLNHYVKLRKTYVCLPKE
ncbi:hypothetical protein XENOCAPTIV_024182 [Xenoophorus captivus]|uniref:Uncharacterized protein n=1 Tax=Xenoophorus captivus TaxID=1517983 RepID=A0ABV0QWF1_9TELE